MPDIAYIGPHDYAEEQLIERLKNESPPTIAIDTESISLKDRTLIGIGIALNEREAVYFPVLPEPSRYLYLAWRILRTPGVKVFFNALHDLYVLTEHRADSDMGSEQQMADLDGWRGASVPEARLPDWLGNGRLADPSAMGHIQALPNNSLQDTARTYIGMKIDAVSDVLEPRQNMLDLSLRDVAYKCIQDCLATYRLYVKEGGPAWWSADSHTWRYEPNWYEGCDPFEPTSYTVTQAMKDCYQVDMKLIPLLMRMSRRGISLRSDLVEDWYKRISKARLFFEDICLDEGFNPASSQQVGIGLANRGNILPFTKSNKQLATGESVLSQLTDPLAVVVLKFREYSTLRSNFLGPWMGFDKDKVAHPLIRIYNHYRMDLSTARLSAYDFHLQNIPERIREIFAPDTGLWTDFDLSQIELRLFAYITEDPEMLKAYAEGSDIHATTQEALWPGTDPKDKQMRRRAKVFNFAKIFYGTVRSLAAYTRLPEAICAAHNDTWRVTYPVAEQWMKKQEEGEPWIENLYGRRCLLPHEIYHTWKHIVNCRVCYPTQSGAAEIIKRIMLELEKLGVDQALQVHDSILIEGRVELPSELAYICPGIHTPFNAPVSPYWS